MPVEEGRASGQEQGKRGKGKAMKSKIVILFNELEALQLKRIVLDKDQKEALKMIEKVILKKIREALAKRKKPGKADWIRNPGLEG